MKAYVFTDQAINAVFNNLSFEPNRNPLCFEADNIIKIVIEDVTFLISTGHSDANFIKKPLIIIYCLDVDLFSKDRDCLIDALQKIHRVSIHCQKRNTMSLPPWTLYHEDNKISISVSNKNSDFRLFIEHNVEKSSDIVVFKMFEAKKNFAISDCPAEHELYKKIKGHLLEVDSKLKSSLEDRKISNYENNYSFDLIFDSQEQVEYDYNRWLEKLSKVQKHFVFSDQSQAIKLKGPAGTGKTLAMQIKAIKILKDCPNAKILYLTHSWTVSCQVQDFFDRLLDSSEIERIDVFPLLSIAEEKVKRNGEIITIGEDSLSGKILQLEIIKQIISEFINTDWVIFKDSCSDFFRKNLENSVDKNSRFAWDIILEIACVIGANGILPSFNANERYKKIERRPWMMSLSNDAELECVFSIYKHLMLKLKEERKVTSDQLINDFLNYLSTYNWYYERADKGYDFLFVDEMQLFNEQERLVFHYLTKNPNEYPVIFMALDPKQSIIETYFDYGLDSIGNSTNGENERSDKSFGKTQDFLLDEAHRYTSQILAFLKHVDALFPAMGFSSDWSNKIQTITSKKSGGQKPIVKFFDSFEGEVSHVISLAQQYATKGFRTAILVLNFEDYIKFKGDERLLNRADFIESKNDTLKLMYAKRRIVVSQPHYVIGLQFDVVLLTSCYLTHNIHDPNQSYNTRRFISDVYLGASRAKHILNISTVSSSMQIPEFLQSAIEKNILNPDNHTS